MDQLHSPDVSYLKALTSLIGPWREPPVYFISGMDPFYDPDPYTDWNPVKRMEIVEIQGYYIEAVLRIQEGPAIFARGISPLPSIAVIRMRKRSSSEIFTFESRLHSKRCAALGSKGESVIAHALFDVWSKLCSEISAHLQESGRLFRQAMDMVDMAQRMEVGVAPAGPAPSVLRDSAAELFDRASLNDDLADRLSSSIFPILGPTDRRWEDPFFAALRAEVERGELDACALPGGESKKGRI